MSTSNLVKSGVDKLVSDDPDHDAVEVEEAREQFIAGNLDQDESC